MNVIHSVEAMPAEVDSLVVLGKQYGVGSSKSDVIVCAAASEDIQAECSDEDAEYIAKWSAQTRVKLEKGKEFLLRLIDAGGGLGKTALRAVRP